MNPLHPFMMVKYLIKHSDHHKCVLNSGSFFIIKDHESYPGFFLKE